MSVNDLIFGWLEISGFLSYPPRRQQRINLNTNRLTAIIGTNFDGGPGERNGAGKTAIIDAVQYLYFGRSNRLPNKGFLNYVEAGPLLVSGSASRGGIDFYVERGESPSVLRLFEKPSIDNADWFDKDDTGRYIYETTKSTKPETTKRIAELLGFDLKLTEVLLVNNPSDRSCYFMKTQEEQRDIQERIFGFTVFTEKAERLRETRKEENRNLATKESALIATRQANDRIQMEITQLEEKAQKWSADRDRLTKFLAQQIKSYEKVDFTHDRDALETSIQLETEIALITRDGAHAKSALCDLEGRHKVWNRKHQEETAGLRQTLAMLSKADANHDIEVIKTRELLKQEVAQIEIRMEGYGQTMLGIQKILSQGMQTCISLRKNIEAIEQKIIKLDESKCPTCGQEWSDTQQHLTHCIEELEKLQAEHDRIGGQLEAQNGDLTVLQDENNQAAHERQTLNDRITALPKPNFRTIEEASAAFARTEELQRRLIETERALNPHEDTLKQETAAYGALQTDLERKQNVLEAHRKLVSTSFETLDELEDARRNYETVQAQFEELQRNENPYRETIDNLRTKVLKEVDETEIRELKTRVEHLTMLITLLADKDSPIRRAVLNEWLPELNMRANRYLELLELPHRMTFDTDMSATFAYKGKSLVFDNLSAGQKLRAWLATNLAFREIFELINYRINLFFIDEVLDKGMSGRGAEVSFNLLNDMVREDKSIFLITHRQELVDVADHVLHVNFQNGLTQLAA